MSYSLTLASGSLGSVVASEDAGVVSLAAVGSVTLGGGDAKGVCTLVSSTSIQLSALQAINLGLGLAAKSFPSVASEIQLVQGLVDAELAKL